MIIDIATANTLFKNKRYLEALELCERVLEAEPTNIEAAYFSGQISVAVKNWSAAKYFYEYTLYIENDRRDNSPALIEWLFNEDYRLWWRTPPLFNADNYFKNPKNIFNNTVSINMICIHKSVPTNIDANEILDINEFPDMSNTPNTN